MTMTWKRARLSYEGRDSSIVSMDKDSIFRGNRRVAFWTLERSGGKLRDAQNFIAVLNAPWSQTVRADSRSELLSRVRQCIA